MYINYLSSSLMRNKEWRIPNLNLIDFIFNSLMFHKVSLPLDFSFLFISRDFFYIVKIFLVKETPFLLTYFINFLCIYFKIIVLLKLWVTSLFYPLCFYLADTCRGLIQICPYGDFCQSWGLCRSQFLKKLSRGF